MLFDYDFIFDNSVKLLISAALGAAIGAEREYKGRNIGFRTIILITLGSTFFTILSFILGEKNDPSRIASNIVTGVGFLGAGAIFRDGASVKGVTTASIIWISAAIGMACGIGQYEFAFLVTFTVLFILLGFAGVQKFIDRYNKEVIYKITLSNNLDLKSELEKQIALNNLKFEWLRQTKLDNQLIIEYEIRGSDKNHEQFVKYLSLNDSILQYQV